MHGTKPPVFGADGRAPVVGSLLTFLGFVAALAGLICCGVAIAVRIAR